MKANRTHEKTAQVSIRLGLSEHRDLMNAAAQAGTTLSDIARERIRVSEKQIELASQLSQLESRLLQKVFQICSAVANLDEDEKREAVQAIKRMQTQRGNSK